MAAKKNYAGLTRHEIIMSLHEEYGANWPFLAPYTHKLVKMYRNFPDRAPEDYFSAVHRRDAELLPRYKELVEQELSVQEIADALNVTKGVVAYRLRKYGLRIKRRSRKWKLN